MDAPTNEDRWNAVREHFGDDTLELGPHYAHQALRAPRHLLFLLARYKFAAKMLPRGRTVDVLELGCSEGLGTMLLAEGGNRVLAVDLDVEAIEHAQRTLGSHSTISFEVADFLVKDLGSFDAIVSLDVIEHIEPSDEDAFMTRVVANLNDDGLCVIGTPNETASPYASAASMEGHINLYTGERLAALVDRYFRNTFVFGLNDEVAHTGFLPMCHYLMVVGSVPRETVLSR